MTPAAAQKTDIRPPDSDAHPSKNSLTVIRGKDGRFASKNKTKKPRSAKSSGPVKFPGAKPTDMANYLCHRIWGNAVNMRAAISWALTDQKFLPKNVYPETEGLRIFYGIGYHGYDVRTPTRAKKGIDLVQIVGETEGFADTIDLYESVFWKMLSDPSPQRHNVLAQARALLKKLGLFQTHEETRRLGARAYPNEPAFQPTQFVFGTTTLPWSDAALSLDHVALLICNYRVALDCRNFDAAKFYRLSILDCLEKLLTKFRIPYSLSTDLKLLVEKRIIAGLPHVEREVDFLSLRSRKRDQRLKHAESTVDVLDSEGFRWMLGDNELHSNIAPVSAQTTYLKGHLRQLYQEEPEATESSTEPSRPLLTPEELKNRLDEMLIRDTQERKPKRGRPRKP